MRALAMKDGANLSAVKQFFKKGSGPETFA